MRGIEKPKAYRLDYPLLRQMESYSYLDNLPEETLVEIFYQPGSESLCGVSRKFNRICQDPIVRKAIYFNYLRSKSEQQLKQAFSDLVSDDKRGGTTIRSKDLEALTWMVEYDNSLVMKKIKDWKIASAPSPLYVTKNTEIYDLLLRYGADPNDHGGIGIPGIFDKVLGTTRFHKLNNSVLLYQLLAYGSNPLQLESGLIPYEYYKLLIHLSYDETWDVLLDMIHRGLYNPNAEVIKDSGAKFTAAYFGLHDRDYSSPFDPYLRVLEYSRLGVEPERLMKEKPVTFLSLFTDDKYLSTFRALCCFANSPVSAMGLRIKKSMSESDPKLYSYYKSLASAGEDLLRGTSLVDVMIKKNIDPYDLDYPHLQQLYINHPYPEWDDASFWEEKLDIDFPGEPLLLPQASTREQYLELYLRPKLSLTYKGKSYNIYLDYNEGRGWLIGTWLFMNGGASTNLKYGTIRLSGKEENITYKDLERLYCFFSSSQSHVAVVELLDIGQKEIIYPNLFRPYAMRLLNMNKNKAHIIQFDSSSFLQGFMKLCMVLGINYREYVTDIWKVSNS